MQGNITFEDVKKIFQLQDDKHRKVFFEKDFLLVCKNSGKKEVRYSVDKDVTDKLNTHFRIKNGFLMIRCENFTRDITWYRCFLKDKNGGFLYDVSFDFVGSLLDFNFSKYDLNKKVYVHLEEELVDFFPELTKVAQEFLMNKNEYRLLYVTGGIKLRDVYNHNGDKL